MAEDSPWTKLSKKERTKLFIFFLCTFLVYVLVGLLIYAIFIIITTKTEELMIDGKMIAGIPKNKTTNLLQLASDEEMIDAIIGKKKDIIKPPTTTELPPATDEEPLYYYATVSPSESTPASFDEMLKAVIANGSDEYIPDLSRAGTGNMIHSITG